MKNSNSITISAIAALGNQRQIGKDNELLWNIPEDLQRFKELTSGKAVIMGRKTWQSLPESVLRFQVEKTSFLLVMRIL